MSQNMYVTHQEDSYSNADILPALLCLKKQIFRINYDFTSHNPPTQLLISSPINRTNNEEEIPPNFLLSPLQINYSSDSTSSSSNLPNLINEENSNSSGDFLFDESEPSSPTRMRLLTHDSKNSPISNQLSIENNQLIDSPTKGLIAVLSVPANAKYESSASTADVIKNTKSFILNEEQAPYDPHCVFTSNKGVYKCDGVVVLDYCVLGCICPSITRETSSSERESCGNFACIFGCLCGCSKYESETNNEVHIVTRLRSRAHLMLNHSFFRSEKEKRDKKVEECKKRESKKMSSPSVSNKRKRPSSPLLPKVLKTVDNIQNIVKNNNPQLKTNAQRVKKFNLTKILSREDLGESCETRVPNFSESFLEKFFISMITEFPKEGRINSESEDEDDTYDEISKEEMAFNIIKGIKLGIKMRSQRRTKNKKRY